MKKFIPVVTILFLSACITPTCNCKSPFEHKFKTGDCAKYNPAVVEKWQYSEGTIFTILDVGIRFYKVKFQPNKMNEPTIYYPKFTSFDEEFIKEDCK